MSAPNNLNGSRLVSQALRTIVPELSEAERKEYFNLHYRRYAETLKECLLWSEGRVLDVGSIQATSQWRCVGSTTRSLA
jgi:hypothetical protein